MMASPTSQAPQERTRSRSPKHAPTERNLGVALVTGASRGIGAAIAQALALEGYIVAVNYKSSHKEAEKIVAGIVSRDGLAAAFQADVAIEAEIVRCFDDVSKQWPDEQLTVLVNNAGVLGPKGFEGKIEQVTAEKMHAVFDTNVLGPLICSREFSKRAARGGRIVNISSGSAYIGHPGLYAMSKGALNSMQTWLVKDLAPKEIRINTISPGMTRTDMIADTADSFDMTQIPLGRFGEPREIADAVVFLCSTKSSYVSGANLRVAGGRPPGTTIG